MSADFDKFLKLEKRLFKLIDDPLSEGPTTSRKIMGKKERIRNKMRKLEPKIKGMKDGGLAAAIEKVKKEDAVKMKEGGDVDKEFPEPKERTAEFRIEMIPKEFRKSFREKFMSGRGETSRKIQEKAKGGEAVPAKFKGFSKLPEAVQEKMNPSLAKKFEVGGPVKMGSGGGVCRGMGAARAGGKFKLR